MSQEKFQLSANLHVLLTKSFVRKICLISTDEIKVQFGMEKTSYSGLKAGTENKNHCISMHH